MFQRFECIGYLGQDAELHETKGGDLLRFSVACAEKWKDRQGEWQEKTHWARCVLWGDAAERLADRMLKGALVHVEDGRLEEQEYEDRDGNKRKSTQVKVRKVRVLKDAEGGGKARDDDEDEPEPERAPRRRETGAHRSRSNGRDTRRSERRPARGQREPHAAHVDDDDIPF